MVLNTIPERKCIFPVIKKELLTALAGELNLSSKKEADKILSTLVGIIREAVENGDFVRITGFGVFKPTTCKPRRCFNPQTGEYSTTRPVRRIGFRSYWREYLDETS